MGDGGGDGRGDGLGGDDVEDDDEEGDDGMAFRISCGSTATGRGNGIFSCGGSWEISWEGSMIEYLYGSRRIAILMAQWT